MTDKTPAGLSLLGAGSTQIPASPDAAVLECFDNPHPGTHYVVRFTQPEFTSLCPLTGQPDFAHFVIDYIPKVKMVESKALKLFFASFRNHGAFHEDCTVMIGKRLAEAMDPHWLRVGGFWYPRGGIPIDIFYVHGDLANLPVNTRVHIPPLDVPMYRGRG